MLRDDAVRRRLRPGSTLRVIALFFVAAWAITLGAGCLGGDRMGSGTNGDPAGDGTDGGDVKLQWLGHAAFLITSPQGTRVLTDPYPATMGYGNRRFRADLVTVSHEHFDHNNVDSVQGSPEVVRGLSGGDWAVAEKTLGDVTVHSIRGTYHDNAQGTTGRGKNALFVIETGGLRILHLGDLGHVPSAEVIERVGRVDVLLVPVGGYFTIDGETAGEVADLFQARIAVPMHFRTEYIADWQISDAEPFLQGRSVVKKLDTSEVTLRPAGLPEEPESWLLQVGP
jgi:L-ascorbate metabolism protein UlaG (beta-lactamase superfamily)